ncbi:MAG: archaeosortase/exosortase family protein, partial [Acidimicrobiales bacterium]
MSLVPSELGRLRRVSVPEPGPVLRVAVVLGAVVAAYHFSLVSLLHSLGLDTPLAYLGLVPVIALLLGTQRARPALGDPPIHDRQIDYIIGTPLLLAAVAIVTLLPAQLSTFFWVWRIDLLSLPLFVAGAVSIAFGTRALWRLRFPIAFLLLAWPFPYTALLAGWLDSFTTFTTGALGKVLAVVPVAQPVVGDGSLFQVAHGGGSFVVSVASACSGANGMVGFLLIGVAFTFLVRGRRVPKAVWLAAGLTLVWV